jgi:hypothetical protein
MPLRHSPPSLKKTLEYLADFCHYHNFYGQAIAALTASLYIPFRHHDLFFLPVPKRAAPRNSETLPNLSKHVIYEQAKLLPYYMTLSSNVWSLWAVLCSTFFEEEIPCNLVGAWLVPAFTIINWLVKEWRYPALLRILA